MAGHSKWKQIKHKKAATDAKKGNLFSKMVREITIAARTGGASLDTNSTLRSVVERAKAEGLPKDNIERAIARSAGGGDEANLQEFIYEATGPGGVMILVEGITDNTNRSRAEIRKVLTDFDARLADPGSVLWNFDKVGVIALDRAAQKEKNDEALELTFIEAGVKDFSPIDGGWRLETEFTALEKVRVALESAAITVKESGHDYKPKSEITVDGAALSRIETIIETLLDLDDVQEAYTNIALG